MKKLRNAIILFLTFGLIIANTISINYSFADVSKPEKVTEVRVSKRDCNSVKLEWCKVKNASGYRVYRSTAKNGIYKVVNVVPNNTPCFVAKDLQSGTDYYFMVRAYKIVNGKTCLGYCSDWVETTTCPEAVKSVYASGVTDSCAQIAWKKVCRASGYEVYRSTCVNKNYKRVATITDGNKSCYKDTNLKRNEKYYYKIRAFKESNGQVCFGCFSDILCIFTKKN